MLTTVIFVSFIASTYAIVCTPQLCNLVDAQPVTCPGKVIKNGGFCGCTDACAKQEGESCELSPQVSEVNLLGVPPAGSCDDNLECSVPNSEVTNILGHGVCTRVQSVRRDMTACEQMRRIRMISMVVWQGMWTPKCDASGLFEAEQCDNTNHCFCVTQHKGTVLESTKVYGSVDCTGLDLTDQ